MKKGFVDVWEDDWIEIERVSQSLYDKMTGLDLWFCIEGRVYGGFHLSGFKEGFYFQNGESVERVGKVTHVMLREPPPRPPYKF